MREHDVSLTGRQREEHSNRERNFLLSRLFLRV